MAGDISAFKLFTRVARLGRFSAAGREAGLSQSQVSRTIADLEADLDGRLLTRTTRAVILTEAGSEFLARIEPILVALEEAQHGVKEGNDLRGTLRVSMPTSIGAREIIPRTAAFKARHPELRIHFILEDRKQDLIRDAVDVSIRIGKLSDSTATFRTMGHISRVFVASPEYLSKEGIPQVRTTSPIIVLSKVRPLPYLEHGPCFEVKRQRPRSVPVRLPDEARGRGRGREAGAYFGRARPVLSAS
jgi:DNA-binding transcriptional LysR family regulator